LYCVDILMTEHCMLNYVIFYIFDYFHIHGFTCMWIHRNKIKERNTKFHEILFNGSQVVRMDG